MYKFLLLTILTITSANAFWFPCADRPGAVSPNRVESPFCSGDLCMITRGESLLADVFTYFHGAHQRLDVRVTAFILGVGVNLPLTPPFDDACNFMFRGGVFVGCPTIPGNVEHLWRIEFPIPATFPAFTNTRIQSRIRNDIY